MAHNFIITNNPLVRDASKGVEVQFYEDLDQFISKVRDLIHSNHKLVTHPLAGNIQAHQHPYRSLVMTKTSKLDMESLNLWETATDYYTRSKRFEYNEETMEDFRHLDYDLIKKHTIAEN